MNDNEIENLRKVAQASREIICGYALYNKACDLTRGAEHEPLGALVSLLTAAAFVVEFTRLPHVTDEEITESMKKSFDRTLQILPTVRDFVAHVKRKAKEKEDGKSEVRDQGTSDRTN